MTQRRAARLPGGGLARTVLATVCLVGCGIGADSEESVHQDVIVRDHRNESLGGGSWDVQATPIYQNKIMLMGGGAVTFETKNLIGKKPDPVLHLLDGSGQQVAFDDDSGVGTNSRFTVKLKKTGSYTVLVRASGTGRGGSCDVHVNGKKWRSGVSFAGTFKMAKNLRVGETLLTVPLPNGVYLPSIYILSATTGSILKWATAPDHGTARIEIQSPISEATIMVGSSDFIAQSGPVRWARNDAALSGHDPDHDGLGTELERAVGTCSLAKEVVGNWSCARSTDVRDTDGDGLSDAHELLGKIDASPPVLLPRWGASPLHKDIFVEVDFMQRAPNEADAKMPPSAARKTAAAYADGYTQDPLLRLHHAQSLNNPDGEPGIAMHLDTGHAPTSPADATIYGDWGGHNKVPPKSCDSAGCTGAEAEAVWRAQMAKSRHGLFYYLLTYNESGGQAGVQVVAADMGHLDGSVVAHEFGHMLGMGHDGPYGYEAVDANCKPNYPSTMNYAYQDSGRFSDGLGRPAINNVTLREAGAVPGPSGVLGSAYLDDLETVFKYTVDRSTGDVDWNRDGVISAGTVKAYSNNSANDCEFTKYNAMSLGLVAMQAPAASRLDGRTLVFALNAAGVLTYVSTSSTFNCGAIRPTGCDGPGWSFHYISQSWNQGLKAADTVTLGKGASQRLLLVFVTSQGQVYESELAKAGLAFSQPKPLEGATSIEGELALATDGSTVWMLYGDAKRHPRWRVRNADGSWTTERYMSAPSGWSLPRMPVDSAPGAIYAPVLGPQTVVAAMPEASSTSWQHGRLRLYTLDMVTRRWVESGLFTDDHGTVGKPAMAYRPLGLGGVIPGRLHLMWIRRPRPNVSRAVMETVKSQPVVKMGLIGAHQNTWYVGRGVELLFDPAVDANLRAIVSIYDPSGNDGRVRFRPRADGILDYPLRSWNDWEILGVGLCRVLAKSSSQNTISCPPWKW